MYERIYAYKDGASVDRLLGPVIAPALSKSLTVAPDSARPSLLCSALDDRPFTFSSCLQERRVAEGHAWGTHHSVLLYHTKRRMPGRVNAAGSASSRSHEALLLFITLTKSPTRGFLR